MPWGSKSTSNAYIGPLKCINVSNTGPVVCASNLSIVQCKVNPSTKKTMTFDGALCFLCMYDLSVMYPLHAIGIIRELEHWRLQGMPREGSFDMRGCSSQSTGDPAWCGSACLKAATLRSDARRHGRRMCRAKRMHAGQF